MKTIIITGDSGGLGSLISKTLLNDNENTYFVVGISRSENDNVKSLYSNHSGRYKHINFDLSYPENIKKLYLNELKNFKNIVGLVNNSAYAYDDLVTNAKVQNLEYMFKINVIAPMMLTKYFIRNSLLNELAGSIVHISSVSAHTGYKGLSMYAATKGAIESYSKGVAREWGRRGIRSNCIAPGFMETQMSQAIDENTKERIYNRTSKGKATDITSVAELTAFLLSEKAKSITGAVMAVDNGTI